MKKAFILLILCLVACTVQQDNPTSNPATDLPPPALATDSPPSAESTTIEYLMAWKKNDFNSMYELLLPESKNTISQEDFVNTYQNVNSIGVFTNTVAKHISTQQNNLDAKSYVDLTLYSSLVGNIHREITLPLKFKNRVWGIEWNKGLILPELINDNNLYMDYIIPSRANIYDRNGLAFAAHTDAVSLGVIPGEINPEQEEQLLQDLSPLLGRHPESLKSLYASSKPEWYVPLGETSSNEIKTIYDKLTSYSGLIMKPYQTRYYVGGKLGAPHAVGYTALIPEEQSEIYKSMGYRGDEFVGVQGLEAWGETYLSGKRGGALHVASPEGKWVTTLAESKSSPAQAIYTTLDRRFQKEVQTALQDLVGAAVVLNMNTGEVLAMASSPSFDPNLFDPANYNIMQLEETIMNPYTPLINRVTQGQYAPGSTFKVVTMASALESNLFNAEQIYYCGHTWTGLGTAYTKYDWTYDKGFAPSGNLTLIGGLRRSCNPWFYQIGISLHNWADYFLPDMSRKFGLGSPTGIIGLQQSINEEVGGIIPNVDWAKETNTLWTPANTVHMAIGQGDIQVTPLQMAQLYAAIGNGGTIYRPQLIQSISAPDEKPSFEFKAEAVSQLPVSSNNLNAVRQGLWEVVNDPSGTANYRFRQLDIPIYGKTGTAEDLPRNPHAWFAGFTNAQRPNTPDFAAVIVLENKGEGSEWAAPIFRRLVEVYFLDEIDTLYPWEVEIGLTATPSPTPIPEPKLHIVQAGESLGSLSGFYKVPLADIMLANNLNNPNLLSPGQELVIPLGGIENLTPTPTHTPLLEISSTPQP